MAHEKNHDYHILQPSVNPLLGALAALVMLTGAILWMHGSGPYIFLAGFVGVLYVMYVWWSEVVTESHIGDHTPVVSDWPALWFSISDSGTIHPSPAEQLLHRITRSVCSALLPDYATPRSRQFGHKTRTWGYQPLCHHC